MQFLNTVTHQMWIELTQRIGSISFDYTNEHYLSLC
jgi:hypothetical protein